MYYVCDEQIFVQCLWCGHNHLKCTVLLSLIRGSVFSKSPLFSAGILPTLTFPTWFSYRSYSWTNSVKTLWWRIVHVLCLRWTDFRTVSVMWSQGKDKLQVSVVDYVPWLRLFDGGESATCTFTAPSHFVNLSSFVFYFHHFSVGVRFFLLRRMLVRTQMLSL